LRKICTFFIMLQFPIHKIALKVLLLKLLKGFFFFFLGQFSLKMSILASIIPSKPWIVFDVMCSCLQCYLKTQLLFHACKCYKHVYHFLLSLPWLILQSIYVSTLIQIGIFSNLHTSTHLVYILEKNYYPHSPNI
jgi:hypothetical protein